MQILALDHLVLTVRDIARTVDFYQHVLGLRHERFEGRYDALHFGQQKINLHPFRAEYHPHADIPAPGTGDLCLIADGRIEDVVQTLQARGVALELGPVERTGARGPMRSVYFRDPDRNLVEVACYGPAA
ncbi:VOC family protein [Piscinibacter sakaiensis]|uniref:Biphenyl-2,3-diol 1,2-dioxygenase III n=1 Tax=Piscinibacter sakaiensis TaxID=1547922 RepID=A0A0K8P733_PISS1|nr:VOC family protein [Piscinibacter sakaiensis]GAP38025.1 biphenyl-2,3-diol 1,2-dioxygenase III [Piscinibacter sakaiensis]